MYPVTKLETSRVDSHSESTVFTLSSLILSPTPSALLHSYLTTASYFTEKYSEAPPSYLYIIPAPIYGQYVQYIWALDTIPSCLFKNFATTISFSHFCIFKFSLCSGSLLCKYTTILFYF